ncbi:PKD domain-containing protein [Tenacibaculum aquimarinum]|uniref:PKD domain-containing protein n=1 Tax=Tenacibaculum aquimarinum TaxID=2910675 RepID=UPI001F0AA7F2|nr:PKD domain-containing protein [Tenacibaculum aquimarinum]MCH3885309.1 PKD domain-containing protein [Tenacibaculum aquimarinum]
MKQIAKKIQTNISKFGILILLFSLGFVTSCEENLPDTGDIADLTPPTAAFSATQGAGAVGDEWMTYSFTNESSSATSYSWDFGNGDTSTEIEPSTTFPGEGSFTVTLVAQDNLGVTSTYSEVIEVVEPLVVVIPDPTLINSVFDKLPKNNGTSSDCACSGWDNDDIGEQGESSSGNGSDVVKFDNNEPDHIYQEFEVVPNADYTIEIITSFKGLENNTPPMDSMLELRILAGSGYTAGYTPTYYATATEYPKTGFGYNDPAVALDPANSLITEVLSNPSDTSYITNTYTFNAGNNDSVALFMRGIGGDSTVGSYGYTSGDEEIRLDSVTITAN